MVELYKRFSLREDTLHWFYRFVLLFWGPGGISRFSQTLRGISDFVEYGRAKGNPPICWDRC